MPFVLIQKLTLDILQDIVCWLQGEPVSPHVLLLTETEEESELLGDCELARVESSIGLLARNNASLSVGVISARVVNEGGWVVTVYPAIHKGASFSNASEWVFQNTSCWFELEEALGFNQSLTLDVDDHLSLQVSSLPAASSNGTLPASHLPLHFADIVAVFVSLRVIGCGLVLALNAGECQLV